MESWSSYWIVCGWPCMSILKRVDVKWVAMEDASRSTSRNASGCPHNNSLGVPNAFTILRFFSLAWSWYNDRRKTILTAKPNAGHMAIANLQNYREVSVITQNIDGLHQIAGSREVIVIIIGSFLGAVFLVIQWMQAHQFIQGQVDWNRVGNDTMVWLMIRYVQA